MLRFFYFRNNTFNENYFIYDRNVNSTFSNMVRTGKDDRERAVCTKRHQIQIMSSLSFPNEQFICSLYYYTRVPIFQYPFLLRIFELSAGWRKVHKWQVSLFVFFNKNYCPSQWPFVLS